MALPANTLTLALTLPDEVTPLEGVWTIRLVTLDGVAINAATGGGMAGLEVRKTVGGVAVFDLPDNTHPDFWPSGGKYRAAFQPHEGKAWASEQFDMDAPKTLKDIRAAVVGPVDSSILAQALAAQLAAETAAGLAEASASDAEDFAASVQRGVPGGVAGLDGDGDVIDADGVKVTGGGVSSWDDLTDKPSTFPPSTHTHDDRYYTETEVDAALTLKRTAANTDPLVIVETSTGVWSADAPAGRTGGARPCEFRGNSDPADPTNGIDTPANLRDWDVWVHPTA